MTSDAVTLSPTNAVGDINKYDFHTDTQDVFKARKGLDAGIVRQISEMKDEPEWMLKFRLKALAHFQKRPTPTWGPDLSTLDLDDIFYYVNFT